MIVGIGIRTRAKSAESPGIDDANEGAVVGTLKVEGQDPLGELLGLKDLPGSAVRHPSHDAGKGRVRQHVLELEGSLAWRISPMVFLAPPILILPSVRPLIRN